MEEVKIYYDPTGNTLTIWLDDPSKEEVSEEIDDEIVLMKDKDGRVIGLEKIIYSSQPTNFRVQFETLANLAHLDPQS